MSDVKQTNPKDSVGVCNKSSPSILASICLRCWLRRRARFRGTAKYGRNNWRPAGALASVYVGAGLRHLLAWDEGEDNAPDILAFLRHLGHTLAALAVPVLCSGERESRRRPPVSGRLREVGEEANTGHRAG